MKMKRETWKTIIQDLVVNRNGSSRIARSNELHVNVLHVIAVTNCM